MKIILYYKYKLNDDNCMSGENFYTFNFFLIILFTSSSIKKPPNWRFVFYINASLHSDQSSLCFFFL